MPAVQAPENPEENPRVKAVFDDIRTTRGSDFVNNIWRYLAFDPALLERTWAEVKDVMATPSALDPPDQRNAVFGGVDYQQLRILCPFPILPVRGPRV